MRRYPQAINNDLTVGGLCATKRVLSDISFLHLAHCHGFDLYPRASLTVRADIGLHEPRALDRESLDQSFKQGESIIWVVCSPYGNHSCRSVLVSDLDQPH